MILTGDCRDILPTLPADSVHCCVTSPPYFGLRSYLRADHPDKAKEIGSEHTPEEFVATLVAVFREVRRLLRDDGTLWLNLGDSYANDSKWGGSSGGKHASALHGSTGVGRTKVRTGLKSKDLIGIPWMVAFALRADGWYLRQDIIWSKPNPMPESVRDRCTKAHEYIFLLSKGPRYYFDAEAMSEPAIHAGTIVKSKGKYNDGNDKAIKGYETHVVGERLVKATRNRRSVWTVTTKPFKGAHFATFPAALAEPCILAGSPPGGVVLDPFFGSGTTGQVAQRLGREWIGIDLNDEYVPLQEARAMREQPGLALGTPTNNDSTEQAA